MLKLFEPLKVGDLQLKNRIIMAPLTRCRARGRVPNSLMVEYYTQRASAGLILTEATSVDPMGVGYPDTPGIWSQEQVEGWKKVTEAVHKNGGLIFLQLWHVGRISHPMYLDGKTPVAPSAIKPAGFVSRVRPQTEFVTPRALEISEIKTIIQTYKEAAQNAKDAGFDGVEIHAANGYLIDQFLQDKTNIRTDEYGGKVQNRAKFLLEIVDAAVTIWGANRVGVHLSPRGDSHDMGDSNPKETFGYVVKELSKRKIAFIFVREHFGENSIGAYLREQFNGVYIANEKLTKETAEEALENGRADAVSFGMLYISNPDLPKRFELNAPLNETNIKTIYAEGATGYTDYPTLE